MQHVWSGTFPCGQYQSDTVQKTQFDHIKLEHAECIQSTWKACLIQACCMMLNFGLVIKFVLSGKRACLLTVTNSPNIISAGWNLYRDVWTIVRRRLKMQDEAREDRALCRFAVAKSTLCFLSLSAVSNDPFDSLLHGRE